VAGTVADRVARPLLWFGAAEMLIGVTALASPLVLDALRHAYVALYRGGVDSPAALTVARFTGSFLVLIVPTALMGASLPLIVRGASNELAAGQRVAWLYGVNTAGAIAGTVAAGFYLIGGTGITATMRLAAAANILVGLAAILLSRRSSTARAAGTEADISAPAGVLSTDVRRRTAMLVLTATAASGFASLALEVIWFRVLVLFMPSCRPRRTCSAASWPRCSRASRSAACSWRR
jgi:spermidine synthase